jgi:small-conductance mechanosensitive channel
MEILGLEITRADLERWLLEARDYAFPRLLQSLGQILLAAALFVIARWILTRIERRFTAKTASQVDDHVIEVIRRSASISIVAWAGWRTAHIWDLARLADFAVAVWVVALTVPLADFLAKLLRVVEEEIVPKTETELDDTALPLLNKFVRFLVIGGGVVIALSYMSIDILPFIAGASVAGVAVGFAAKDTLSNLIAGVLLIVDRPFHVGDRIELWQAPQGTATWGDVIEIGLRATKIRNPDNLIFVIPNNQIMQRDIVNYTASGDNIRLRIPIGIAYDADPAKAKGIIREVALDVEGVMHEPPPQIILRNFGESSVDLELRVWIDDARKRRSIGDEITDRVKTEFDRAGVEIPYAKRDLYIRAMPAEGPSPPPGVTVESSRAQPKPQGEDDG